MRNRKRISKKETGKTIIQIQLKLNELMIAKLVIVFTGFCAIFNKLSCSDHPLADAVGKSNSYTRLVAHQLFITQII